MHNKIDDHIREEVLIKYKRITTLLALRWYGLMSQSIKSLKTIELSVTFRDEQHFFFTLEWEWPNPALNPRLDFPLLSFDHSTHS